MKRHLLLGTAVLLLASATAAGGYWLGFRHGANLALVIDAVPRGVMAVGNLRLLEKGQPESVRFYLESEVDTGLMLRPQMIQHVRDQDPSMAKALDEGELMKRQAIEGVLRKYRQ